MLSYSNRVVSITLLCCAAGACEKTSGEPSGTGGSDPSSSSSTGGAMVSSGSSNANSSSSSSAASSGTLGAGGMGGMGTGGTATSTVSSTSSTGGTGGAGTNSPPTILQASTNASVVKSGDSLSISVVATDVDGIDDLIGGVVESPTGATYASLITSAQEGAYQVELTWDQINITAPIDIPPGQQLARPFVIVVFDQAGASTKKTVSVLLESAVADWAVCNGAAVDPLSEQNCGACGFSCLDSFGSSYGGALCIDDGGVFCEKTKWIALSAADGSAMCGERCEQAAGPSAFSSFASSCDVIDGAGGCPVFANCAMAAFDALPLGCVGPSTVVQCKCSAYWQSPGF